MVALPLPLARFLRTLTVSLPLVWSAFAGCTVVDEAARMPARAVSAILPSSNVTPPDPAVLQAELQRYCDEFIVQTMNGIDGYARTVGTTEAERRALGWKLGLGTSAVGIVSGPNPTANLLDFIAFATLIRTALEEEWVKSEGGEAFQPWLKSSRILEMDAWRLAEGVLTTAQQQEHRESINDWWGTGAGSRRGFLARPQTLTSRFHASDKTARPESVFALIGLDPTGALDPAVREVTHTRLFAERAMYTAQRMPLLLRWQTELLTDHLLQRPELEATLANVTSLAQSVARLSRASESVSETAAHLPDRFTAERKALLAALDTQEGRLRELSTEVGRTLLAGERLSTSLNSTILTVDSLMKRFGVGEPGRAPAAEDDSPPFNILEYAETADRLTYLAKEWDALIKDVGNTLDSAALTRRLQDLDALAGRAKEDVKSVMNHAFLLAAIWVVLVFLLLAAYRALARRGASAPSATRGEAGDGGT